MSIIDDNDFYLLKHKTYGIFLGEFLGMGFWSNLESGGQEFCTIFEKKEYVQPFIDRHIESDISEELKEEDFEIIKTKPDLFRIRGQNKEISAEEFEDMILKEIITIEDVLYGASLNAIKNTPGINKEDLGFLLCTNNIASNFNH